MDGAMGDLRRLYASGTGEEGRRSSRGCVSLDPKGGEA
jgi:hypothetical protein